MATVHNRDTLTTSRPTFATAQTNFNYGYDDLDRLVQATRPITGDPDKTFDYDPVGNRLQRDGNIIDNTFDIANRLLEDANFTYTYDDNGNTTSKTDKVSLEVVEYTYDPENRLIGITDRVSAGGAITQAVAYAYDATGRRIQKDVDGAITGYVYDGPDILFEFDGADVQQARYTHGPSMDEPLIMERDAVVHCYHANELGSITELTDNTGSVVQSYLYESYGKIIQTTGTLENSYTFTGRELDAESGLYYYRARYYDSDTGRFINEDPFGLNGGLNYYSYVAGNPANWGDPWGLLQKNDDGSYKFTPKNKMGVLAGSNNKSSYAQPGVLYADDGTEIIAYKNCEGGKIQPHKPGFDSNCHGFTFADGQFWIPISEVDKILKGDNFTAVDGPPDVGDIVVYTNSKGENLHSAIISSITDGIETIAMGGPQISPRNESTNPAEIEGVWHNPSDISVNFYSK